MKVVSRNLRIEGEAISYVKEDMLYKILWNQGGFYWKTWCLKDDFYFIVKAPSRRVQNA